MAIDIRATDKQRIPASLLGFMQLNAVHANLVIAGLPGQDDCNLSTRASTGPGRDWLELSSIYRRFAAALNTHVYLDNARDIPPPIDEYELLCYCMVSADTLSAGIERAMRFVRALNGRGGTLSLTVDDHRAVLNCEVGWTRRSISALSLDMLSITFYCKLFSWLIAEPLTDLEVTLSHQELLDPIYLHDLLPCRSGYGGTHTSISFDAQLLSRPILRTQRQLTDVLAIGPLEFLHMQDSVGVSAKVSNLLRKALIDQRMLPPIDRIAQRLGKSSSTLRRRLAAEGVTFQSLLDECRKSRALELLETTQLTVDEIAGHVGFSERSAFSHAFKAWTDHTPSAYREQLTNIALHSCNAA